MKKFFQLYLESYKGLSRPQWVLAIIMLINRSGAMVLPFLGVYMTQSLGFRLSEAGMVLSCFGLGAMIGSSFGGWLTDKIGHFKVQAMALFLSAPLFCLLPQFRDPVSLSIAICVLSMVTETFRPANSVSIITYAAPHNMTKAFSLNRMAVNLGFSIGPALGGLLATISYSFLFYGNALAALLAGTVFLGYFRNRKGVEKGTGAEAPPKNVDPSAPKAISPWRNGPFLLFSLLCSLFSICFFQLLSTLPLFYREVHRLSEPSIGLLLALSGFMVFSMEMLLVDLAERHFSVRFTIALGTFLTGASFALLLIPGHYWILVLGMLILSIAEIWAMPFMATVTMKMAPLERRGTYMGVNALTFSMAHTLSPYLGTKVASLWGFLTLWACTALLAALVSLGFWTLLKRPGFH